MIGCKLKYCLELLLVALFAASAFAVNVAPLYFNGVAEDEQQGYWEDLMKYKLWGTTGIEFDDRHIVIDDANGYTGTASGNFIIDQPYHTLGGAILVGGNLEIDDGKWDTLKVGPVHVVKDLIVPKDYAMEKSSRFYGDYCIGGGISGNYAYWRSFLSDGLVYGNFPEADAPYADCPTDVPSVDTHLAVPDWVPPADAKWIPAINMTMGYAQVDYIDVPSSVSSSEVFDAYVEGISMAGHADKRLYIRMQKGGRLTRLYVRDGLNIQGAANAAKIQILYVNDGATWNGSTWENFDLESSEVVNNIDYGGNLLIYTPQDIEWPHFNQSNDAAIFQGTYMTSGKLSVKGHIMVAGQFISNNLYFSNEITGDFRYVPFDPSKIGIRTKDALNEKHEVEGDTVKVYLDKAPPTAVPFSYCFEFMDTSADGLAGKKEKNYYAHRTDLVDDTIPECHVEAGVVVGDFVKSSFAKGQTDPVTPIVLHAEYDALDENKESFRMWVCDLEAAVYADGDRTSNCYPLTVNITNVAKNPLSRDTTITVVKDKSVNISSFPALAADSTVLTEYSVKIVTAPTKGKLTLNGVVVTSGMTVKSTDFANLFYVNAEGEDQYGAPYETVTFAIEKFDVLSVKNYTMTINVVSTIYPVPENISSGTYVGKVEATSIKSGSTFSMLEPTGTFEINPTTGFITVKDSTVNYEAPSRLNFADHGYAITVYVQEAGIVVDSVIALISVLDRNDPPVLADTVMSVKENEPKGTTVGVLDVFDEDYLGTGFRQNELSIVGGDSEWFTIDSKTGEIKTNAPFDYEALEAGHKFYTITVKVEDNDGNTSEAQVQINIVNVVELSKIVVTHAETVMKNYVKDNPDPSNIWVNENNVILSWTGDGIEQPDTTVTELHEGYNTVQLYYFDKTKDSAAVKNVIVFVCTKTPEVNVATDAWSNEAGNIFTVAEQRDEGDTAYYVNKSKNPITIAIKEPVLDETYTDSTCNYNTKNIELDVQLETLTVDDKSAQIIKGIAEQQVALNELPSGGFVRTPFNDSLFLITYTDKVNGVDVEVSYVTNSDGDVQNNEITVSYATTIDGETAKLSYKADAITGAPQKDGLGGEFTVSYVQKDSKGNEVEVSYSVGSDMKQLVDSEGNTHFEVTYTYVSEIGNTARQSIHVVLDVVPPKVEIISPVEDELIYTNFVDVEWTVDREDGKGAVTQDTLVTQGLNKGTNGIIRFYCDKAHNCDSAIVYVIMKNAKDVDISVEQPVTLVTRDKAEEYYAANAPAEGEKYAISIYNTKTGKEVETQVGGKNGTVDGSGDEPYPGLEGHLGPTVVIDVKVPSVSGLGGLATLDDLLDKSGNVLLDGIDGNTSNKMTVNEYVDTYCEDDFKTQLGAASTSDIKNANLYNTVMTTKIWVYTSLGSFVEYFEFDQPLDNPSFVNDAAVMTLFFEMKPDLDGYVRSNNGRLFGTGAYIYKTEVDMKTSLRCTLPPVKDPESNDILPSNRPGYKRKVSESMLKPFGYKRPKNK